MLHDALNGTASSVVPKQAVSAQQPAYSQTMRAIVSGLKQAFVGGRPSSWTRTTPLGSPLSLMELTPITRRYIRRRNVLLYGPDGLKTKLWALEKLLTAASGKNRKRIDRHVKELSVRVSHLRVLDAMILSDLFVQSGLIAESYGFMIDSQWTTWKLEKSDLALIIDRFEMVGTGTIGFPLRGEPDLTRTMLNYPGLVDEHFGSDHLLLT